MKRVVSIGLVLIICLIFAYGCTEPANNESEISTEMQNVEAQKNKTEFVEAFEKQFEKASENDTVKSFLSEIYPNYFFEVINKDSETPILEVSTPANRSLPGYRMYFKKNAKVFLNGEPAKLSDIKEGDCISIHGQLSPVESLPRDVRDIDFVIIYR